MFELLEKPRRYKKDKNKDLFKKFNEKLKEYNTLVSQDAPENLRITALQEIDFSRRFKTQNIRFESKGFNYPMFKKNIRME